MGDMGDFYRDMRDFKKARRLKFGVSCPQCQQEHPRRQPTILEPGQRCNVHRPPYRDPRPPLTQADIDTL